MAGAVNYALLVISDGRDNYLTRTLCSALESLPKPKKVILVDDRAHLMGFAGAIQTGWNRILAETHCEFIAHLECDFTFNQPIPLERMAALAADPHIAQVALKRQPWSVEEVRAGGIVETDPDSYEEGRHRADTYTAHRKFFTTNPSIYRRDIAERGWPQVPESEGHFGISLFEDPAIVSTFWGGKFDAPLVHHIGDSRAGHGY